MLCRVRHWLGCYNCTFPANGFNLFLLFLRFFCMFHVSSAALCCSHCYSIAEKSKQKSFLFWSVFCVRLVSFVYCVFSPITTLIIVVIMRYLLLQKWNACAVCAVCCALSAEWLWVLECGPRKKERKNLMTRYLSSQRVSRVHSNPVLSSLLLGFNPHPQLQSAV